MSVIYHVAVPFDRSAKGDLVPATWGEAAALQGPLADGTLRIVARRQKRDGNRDGT